MYVPPTKCMGKIADYKRRCRCATLVPIYCGSHTIWLLHVRVPSYECAGLPKKADCMIPDDTETDLQHVDVDLPDLPLREASTKSVHPICTAHVKHPK